MKHIKPDINKIREFSVLHFLCMAVAFCFILFPKLVPAIIYLMFLSVFFEGNLKQRITQIKLDTFSISMTCFFMVHVIGLFYSDNVGFGLMDLEIKIPFLLLPFVFSVTSKKISSSQFHLFFKIYSLTALVYIVYCFIHAFQDFEYYRVAHNLAPEYTHSVRVLNYFTKYYLSPYHTTYVSMHYCILLCYWLFKSINFYEIKKTKLFSLLMAFVFFVFNLFLYSKAGIIGTLIITVFFIGYIVFKFKRYILGLAGLLFFIIIMMFSAKLLPNLTLRVNSILGVVKNHNAVVEDEGTMRRVMSWKASVELIKNNFIFGVGTGDIKDELLKVYYKKAWFENYAYKLNSHSQYLQTFAALGLVGFLSYICIYYGLFKEFFSNKNYFVLLLMIIFLLNSAFESVLEVQVGTTFFSFISCFFVYYFKNNNEFK